MPLQFVNIAIIAEGIGVIFVAEAEVDIARNQRLIAKVEAMRPVILLHCYQTSLTDASAVLDTDRPLLGNQFAALQAEFPSCILHEHKTKLWTNSVEPYYMIRYQYILSSAADLTKLKSILEI